MGRLAAPCVRWLTALVPLPEGDCRWHPGGAEATRSSVRPFNADDLRDESFFVVAHGLNVAYRRGSVRRRAIGPSPQQSGAWSAVATSMARPSRLPSSSTFSVQNRRPPYKVSCMKSSAVGSRAGAVLRRRGLSVSPRFLWECLTSRTVSPFPAPATSYAACGFPALRAPAHFPRRVM